MTPSQDQIFEPTNKVLTAMSEHLDLLVPFTEQVADSLELVVKFFRKKR
jgi:hypothetical protein